MVLEEEEHETHIYYTRVAAGKNLNTTKNVGHYIWSQLSSPTFCSPQLKPNFNVPFTLSPLHLTCKSQFMHQQAQSSSFHNCMFHLLVNLYDNSTILWGSPSTEPNRQFCVNLTFNLYTCLFHTRFNFSKILCQLSFQHIYICNFTKECLLDRPE